MGVALLVMPFVYKVDATAVTPGSLKSGVAGAAEWVRLHGRQQWRRVTRKTSAWA
jgi:hypothetical protein